MIELFSNFDMVINIISVLALILFCIKGYKDGFVLSLYDLVAFIVILFIAYALSTSLSLNFPLISDSFLSGLKLSSDELLNIIINTALSYFANLLLWFVILLIGLNILSFFIRKALKGIKCIPLVGSCNQILGFVLGIVKAYVFVVLLGWVLSFPVFSNGKTEVSQSVIEPIHSISAEAFTFIQNSYDIKSIMNQLTGSISDFAQLSQEQMDELITQAAQQMSNN